MKKLINQILPVQFGMELNEDIESIEFIFVQPPNIRYEFKYPSENATLSQEYENTIELFFSKELTKMFSSVKPIQMDTRITIKDSKEQPETEQVEFYIKSTLFKE